MALKQVLARIIAKLRREGTRLLKRFRKYKRPVNKEELLQNLNDAGIKRGDTIMVHSSLSKIGNVSGGADTIIDALIECVGEKGNVVMPAYSYIHSMQNTAMEKEYVFDPEKTVSVVGLIPELFRKRPNVRRSVHPTHSVSALGIDSHTIVSGHFSASSNFGEQTPYHKVRELKGKVVGIGVGIPFLNYHSFDDFFPEEFPGVYLPDKYPIKVRVDNQIRIKEIFVHDRDFHKVRIDKNPEIESWLTRYLRKKGILHEGRFGSGNLWWMDFQQLFDELLVLKKRGISIYNIQDNETGQEHPFNI